VLIRVFRIYMTEQAALANSFLYSNFAMVKLT
jgi:hypothetical protein